MISGSKIMIMKAIHNQGRGFISDGQVVISSSKIMIMKAIHNFAIKFCYISLVVISSSKIMIMKAIHNSQSIAPMGLGGYVNS